MTIHYYELPEPIRSAYRLWEIKSIRRVSASRIVVYPIWLGLNTWELCSDKRVAFGWHCLTKDTKNEES